MGTRLAPAFGLLIAVWCPSPGQQPSGTRPPLHPRTAGDQPHHLTITAADPGDGGRRFSVVATPKVRGEYCVVEQGHLTVRDGDKVVCACPVQAETATGGRGFTFTVAAAYLDRSRFAFTVATADPAERKKLPSTAGWVGYEFTLKDFADPPKQPIPPGEKAPPDVRPNEPAPRKESASSKVVVGKTTLTFDPKTCTEGRGLFFWGLGSCAVKVLGREGGRCVFEYTEEVEMGATVYLVKVPADAGPVTVKIDTVTKGGGTYDWPVTSFPLDKAKVVRRGGGRGIWSYRVGDTEAFVTVHPSEGRSEMIPATGDAVKFRFELFAGSDFKSGLPGAAFRPTAEFVAGSDDVWPWLRLATEGMAVGDRVRAEVPAEVAEGARGWLPAGSRATVLYLEVGLVSTGRRR